MNSWVKSKRFPLVVVLFLSIVILAACSDQAGNNAPGTNDSEGDNSSEGDMIELTMFVNHPWWPLKNWSGKVPEEITEKTGVKLNIQVAADDKQLGLMIASENLPDLVYTASEIDRMSHADISHSWNELIAQYAPDFEIEQDRVGVNTVADGNFYTILNGYSTEQEWKEHPTALPGGSPMAIRDDLMEELGNPKLDTLDDFVNILAMVKENYPDIVPLVFDKDQIGQFFRINYGLKRSGFVDIGGDAAYYLKDPNYLDYYLYMNNLYREGYLLTENFTFKDAQQDDQFTLNGQVFAHGAGDADMLNAQLEELGKDFRVRQVTKVLHDEAAIPMGGKGWSGVFITKNNKNPEASIKLMQFMMSEEGQRLGMWGIEGEDWYWNDEEDRPVMNYNMNDQSVQMEKGVVWWGLLGSSGVNEAIQRFEPDKQTSQWGMAIREVMEFNPPLGLVDPPADSNERTIMTQIQEMTKNEELKIYLADSEEEAKKAYEEMLNKANSIGLEQLEAWATEQYHENQKLF